MWPAVFLALSIVAAPAAASASEGPRCDRLVFPVALSPGEPADLDVVAWLCAEGPLEDKTMQVLVHGAGYDHNVWDFPYKPRRYSYVRAATSAGYATLNLDRLGHGESSRVPGHLLDLEVGAFAVHQVIQAVRAGEVVSDEFGPVRAERVLIAGESLGANIAWTEAALYRDVDGLVSAGSAHHFARGLDRVRRLSWPVERDPAFRGESFPPGYLTTKPFSRFALFYANRFADPIAVLVDESLKQTVTVAENAGVPPTLPLSFEVDVPTLITVGNFDDLFCDPPSCTASGDIADEPSFFGPGSCAELVIMPESGHVLNLHENAPEYFEVVTKWADRRVGGRSDEPPPEPCVD